MWASLARSVKHALHRTDQVQHMSAKCSLPSVLEAKHAWRLARAPGERGYHFARSRCGTALLRWHRDGTQLTMPDTSAVAAQIAQFSLFFGVGAVFLSQPIVAPGQVAAVFATFGILYALQARSSSLNPEP